MYVRTYKMGYVHIRTYVRTYSCTHVESDLTYPYTSVLDEIADEVKELDK